MPQQRRSLEDLYGVPPMPSSPRRRSLDDLYAPPADTAPVQGGALDRLGSMGWRDWLGTGTRLVGGYLAGIPAAVPGVGSAIGAGIGGGSEALAQWIAGEDWNPAAMGVGAAAGAIPMGKLFKTAAGLAGHGANALKGAGLNVGVDMAYRGAQGEVPLRDYSLREELVPGLIGAGGGAATSVVGKWLADRAKPVGAGRTAGAMAEDSVDPGGFQGGFNFDAPAPVGGGVSRDTLARARAAMTDPDAMALFDHTYGPVGPAPRSVPRPPSRTTLRAEAAAAGPPAGSRPKGPMPADIDVPLPVPAGPMASMRRLEELYEEAATAGPPAGSRVRGPLPADIDEPITPPADILARMLDLEDVNALPYQSGGGRAPRGPLPADIDQPLPMPGGPSAVPPGASPIDLLVQQLGLDDGLGAGKLDVLDPFASMVNASGESAASLEALSRQRGMQARGQSFVVYDRTGAKRPLLGPDAVDYTPRPGETYGLEGPQGFMALTDNGGRAPQSNPAAFRSEPFGGPQPVLPESGMPPGREMLTPPSEPVTVPRGTLPDATPPPPGLPADEPRPFYAPRQVLDLFKSLREPWGQDALLGAQRKVPGAAVDPLRSLEDFATETMFEPDPRRLMGRQRSVRKAIDEMDPNAIEMVDAQGRPMVDPLDAPTPAPGRPPAAETVAAMLEPPTSQAPAAAAARAFTSRPTISQRADEIINEFLDAAGDAPAGADPYYHRADAYRQAQDAALERLRADIPASTPYTKLPTDLQAEVRRIYDEMDSLRFTEKSFDFTVPGQGGTPDVRAGAAGAPVFHDIMEGRGGSRGGVLSAMQKYMDGKKPSKLAQRALDVALRRLAGQGSQQNPLSRAQLPPDAGYGGHSGVPLGPEGRPFSGVTGAADDFGSEVGAINPGALYTLGSAGAGAVAGPLLDKEGADPLLSAAGGGLTGAVLATALRNPALLERIQSSSLFSNLAPLTSAIGNLGGLAAFAAEHPQSAGHVLRETFSPDTLQAMQRAFKSGVVRENVEGFADQPMSSLSIPGRLIGAPDAATRDIVQRAMVASGEATGQGALPGFPNREVAELGGRYTLSGDPRSTLGKSTLDYLSKNRLLRTTVAPVARTPLNWLETGLERTPGVGFLPGVQAMDPDATITTRVLRQLGGLGAVGAGAALGNELEDSEYNKYLPVLAAAAGPFGLPLTAGSTLAQLPESSRANPGGLDELLAVLENIKRQIPIVGQTYFSPAELLKRFVPYGGLGRLLSGVDPRELDTRGSYFGPAASQVPIANEYFLPPRRQPQR